MAKKLSDFRPQAKNANLHTPKGLGMLDQSIAEGGFIGAITTVADGEVIDGSARLETVYTRFGEGVEPIVVRSRGDRPIIHIREDIPTADDPRAKKLAISANRVAEVDLNWDTEILQELDQEIDLSGLFSDEDFNKLVDSFESENQAGFQVEIGTEQVEAQEARSPVDGQRYPLAVVLTYSEFQEWRVIKEALGEKQDTKAFLKLMRGDHG